MMYSHNLTCHAPDVHDRVASPRPPGLGQRLEVDSTDLNVVERRAIERVMREVAGNKAKAAQRLGISRTQLYGRLRKHGLECAGE
jgi:transcriptional regulator with PAS, ATPase and Fis domain